MSWGQTLSEVSAALSSLISDLASTSSGKGSDMVGARDTGTLYTGVTANVSKFLEAVRTAHVLKAATELTIASGAVTVTQGVHTIDTESDAATDDLDTINGGVAGQFLRLAANNAARVTRIRHGQGNIQGPLSMDVVLDGTNRWVQLYNYDGSNWAVVDVDGWITTTLTGSASDVTLTIPDVGTHLEVEVFARGTNSSATVNCLVTWNGDTTATNYFFQRGGASGNAAIGPQGNTAAITVMPGNTAAASYFGFLRLFFPFVRDTGKVRDCRFDAIGESTTSNRFVHIGTLRRTTAGSGAMTDRVSTVNVAPSAGSWAADSIFRFRVLR